MEGTPKQNQERLPPKIQTELDRIIEARDEINTASRELRAGHIGGPEEGEIRRDLEKESKALSSLFENHPDKQEDIATYLFERSYGYLVFSPDLPGIDFNKIAHHLLENGKVSVIADSIDNFPARHQDEGYTNLLDLSVARALLVAGHIDALKSLDRFAEVDDEIIDALIALDHKPSYDSGVNAVINNAADFPNLNQVDIAKRIFNAGHWKYVVRNLNKFPPLPREILAEPFQKWIDGFEPDMVTDIGYFQEAIRINKQYTPPLSDNLLTFVSVAGSYPSLKLFEKFNNGSITEGRLRELMKNLRAVVESGNPENLAEILKDEDALEAFSSYLRIDVSQYGDNDWEDTGSTEDVIERYLRNKDTYSPLPEGYETATLAVAKIDKKKESEVAYAPEFRERWPVIIKALSEAQRYAFGGGELSQLKERFRDALGALRAERRENVEKQVTNPKARAHAEKVLAESESVSLSDLENTFTTLFDAKKTKDLNSIFLTFGFLVALKRNPNVPSPALRAGIFSEPTIDEISEILNFVTHIAHQETWEKLGRFADKKAREQLNQLFHTKALEEQLSLMQEGRKASKETVSITARPSRDILTEFSGHMSDACWASKYEILDRPNITSLSFFMDEQVAGSCLLIDTNDTSGNPVSIIRGLNPLESVINKLDMESYVQALVAYLEPIAQKRGRKLAIVIDDHAGGASTNRPLLFNYLRGLKRALKRCADLPKEETEFNGYDIRRDTYEISSSVFA